MLEAGRSPGAFACGEARSGRNLSVVAWTALPVGFVLLTLATMVAGCQETPPADQGTPVDDASAGRDSAFDDGTPIDADSDRAADSSVDHVDDLGEPVEVDVGNPPTDAPGVEEVAADVQADAPVAPSYGPWTFASESDVSAWQVSALIGNPCTFQRDPENGGSLKVTITSYECGIRLQVTGLPVQDRRFRMRMRSEANIKVPVTGKVFAQQGGRWIDNAAKPLSGTWQTRYFDLTGAWMPAGFDSTKIDFVGAVFEGGPATVWIDEVELTKSPESSQLPTFELTHDLEELVPQLENATLDAVEIDPAGFVSIKGSLGKKAKMGLGGTNPGNFAAARTLRARVRASNAAELSAFVKIGTSWLWFPAPSMPLVGTTDWLDFVWDLRDVPGLDYVREWGIFVVGVEGPAQFDIDYIRFDTVPVPDVDAGGSDAPASDAAVSDAGDDGATVD